MTKEQSCRVIHIQDDAQAKAEMAAIGVSRAGIACMTKKAQFSCLKIKNLSCKSANIVKQEMLARGGEAAVSADTLYAQGETDVLLMGTHLQLFSLAEKLQRQPLGLKAVGQRIHKVLEDLQQTRFSLPLSGGKTLELSEKHTCIMGIVNVTPDSFSDGGRYFHPEAAIKKALQLKEEGADIIDLGAVSSRPGAALADAEEEWRRLEPVLQALGGEEMLLSVDTFRAEVAEKALDMGAHIINDIGGFRMDGRLAEVVAKSGCPVVVMHNRMHVFGKDYTDFLSDVVRDLEESQNIGIQAGVKPEQMIVDPGIGFGKTPAQNRLLVKRLETLKTLGRPILVGISRKSFIADTLPVPPEKRDAASMALGVAAVLGGAHILRVHDVSGTVPMLQIIDEMRNENG